MPTQANSWVERLVTRINSHLKNIKIVVGLGLDVIAPIPSTEFETPVYTAVENGVEYQYHNLKRVYEAKVRAFCRKVFGRGIPAKIMVLEDEEFDRFYEGLPEEDASMTSWGTCTKSLQGEETSIIKLRARNGMFRQLTLFHEILHAYDDSSDFEVVKWMDYLKIHLQRRKLEKGLLEGFNNWCESPEELKSDYIEKFKEHFYRSIQASKISILH